MRVIFSGLANARKVVSIGAVTVLQNTLLPGKKPLLTAAAHEFDVPGSGDPQSRFCSNNAQAIAGARLFQTFRLLLQEILTGGSGQGMPLFMYRQSEVLA